MIEKLAIISVTYNNYPLLEDFLASLKKQKNKSFHLFLTDLSTQKQSIEQDGVSISVLKKENRGYAYGVNNGLKQALIEGFEKFCIINDDTYFRPDFVDRIFSSLSLHPSAVIGGKIYYAPGYEYHKERYQKSELGKVIWYAGGAIDWSHMITPHRGVDEIDQGQYDTVQQTSFITGCLVVFDRQVIDTVGFWNETYFLTYEDVDFSIRAARKSIALYYDPSLVIWHKVSQSTGGSGSLTHKKYLTRNQVRVGLKYAPLKTKLHLLKNYLLGFLK